MSYSAMAIGVGHSSSKKPMTTTRLSCAPNCQVSIPRRTWWSRSSTTSWSSGLKDPSHTGVTATTFIEARFDTCLLYTSDAADDLLCVDLGGRRIIKKKKNKKMNELSVNTRKSKSVL